MMELPKLFVSFGFLLAILVGQNISGVQAVRASSYIKMRKQKVTEDAFQPTKLFVFGDSYADTGNDEFNASNWNTPYGMTNPGQPAGRYSDGSLLTDYVAKYYGLRTPTAYRFVNPGVPQMLQYGVNFAYGGTGVFDTNIRNPNMSTQIGFLNEYLNDHVVNMTDSLSLLSVNGNDYVARLQAGGTMDETFIDSVVIQIVEDMKNLYNLGARKIAVTAMPPPGCIPFFAPSPNNCLTIVNLLAEIHNNQLSSNVSKLNNDFGECTFFILDLYSAFTAAYEYFPTPYEACCVGKSSDELCGEVDEQGLPLYNVCSDPNSAFYWDLGHPAQAGWNAAYQEFSEYLEKIKTCSAPSSKSIDVMRGSVI